MTPDPAITAAGAAAEPDVRSGARRALLLLLFCAAVAVPIGLLIPLGPSLSKAFWFDEQWRAYYIAYQGNWWQALTADNAPFAAGWYLLERAVATLFGTTELTLRLATAAWLPLLSGLLFLLASRFVRPPVALVVALLGSLVPGLIPYVVQLKPFVIDSAAAVAVVYFFLLAHSPPLLRRRHGAALRLLSYLAVATACVFSVGAVLVAGPLLLVDAAVALRRRDLAVRLLGAGSAGVIALLALGVFVLRQNALTRSTYWAPQFLPHASLSAQIGFVANGLAGFLANAFSPSPTVLGGAVALPGHLSALACAWTLALVVGAVEASRQPAGRWLLLAVLGSLLVALVASYFRYWPFGFVRPNLFELPLLALLAGIGATRCGREALWAVRWLSRPSALGSLPGGPPLLSLAAAVALAGFVAGTGLAAAHEATAYASVAGNQEAAAYGWRIPEAVALVRKKALPNAAIIVAGAMAIPGWAFYLFEYTGSTVRVGRPIPPSHVLFITDHGSPRITTFLSRVRPSEVYVYIPIGTTGQELGQDLSRAAALGYCSAPKSYPVPASGLLTLVAPSPRCPTA